MNHASGNTDGAIPGRRIPHPSALLVSAAVLTGAAPGAMLLSAPWRFGGPLLGAFLLVLNMGGALCVFAASSIVVREGAPVAVTTATTITLAPLIFSVGLILVVSCVLWALVADRVHEQSGGAVWRLLVAGGLGVDAGFAVLLAVVSFVR